MSLPASLTHPWFDARFYGQISATGFRVRHGDGRAIGFAEAQGLQLWCPCGFDNPRYPLEGGRPHGIWVPFANPPCGIPVPPEHGPIGRDQTHPRWTVAGGTGLHDLTLTPSIDVGDDHCWHGYITNGQVR